MTPDTSIFDFERNTVVSASAGTGKTYVLTGVLLHMLLGCSFAKGRYGVPVSPSHILATTFSKFGAQEIEERLIFELKAISQGLWLHSKHMRHIEESFHTHAKTQGMHRRLKKNAETALAWFEMHPGQNICTLHSFASRMLHRYADESHFSDHFKILTETEAVSLSQEAALRVIEHACKQKKESFFKLVDTVMGLENLASSLIRLAHEKSESLSPELEHIAPLATEITEARAFETLKTCVRKLCEDESWKKRDEASDFLRYVSDEKWDLAEYKLAELFKVKRSKKMSPDAAFFFEQRERYRYSAGHAKEQAARAIGLYIRRREFDEQRRCLEELLAFYTEFELRLYRERGGMAMHSLLQRFDELLIKNPHIALEIGTGLDALLIDEFQDTSPVQCRIINSIWLRPEVKRKAKCPPSLLQLRPKGLFVVGDRKQSIYAFRGGDVRLFFEMGAAIAGETLKDAWTIHDISPADPARLTIKSEEKNSGLFFTLKQSRRSSPPLVNFINAFSQIRFMSGAKNEAFAIRYKPETEDLIYESGGANHAHGLGDHLPEDLSQVDLKTHEGSTKFTSQEKNSVIWYELHEQASLEDEASQVTRIIQEELSLGNTYRDIAVLGKKHDILARVALELAKQNVPYVLSGRSFFSAREVRDLTAMLELILFPTRTLALAEVLCGPWMGASVELLLKMTTEKGLLPLESWSFSVFSVFTMTEEEKNLLIQFKDKILDLHSSIFYLGAYQTMARALHEFQFLTILSHLSRSSQRVDNSLKWLHFASNASNPFQFFFDIKNAQNQKQIESEAQKLGVNENAVSLMTVHRSKGLSFPIVILPSIHKKGKGSSRHPLHFFDGQLSVELTYKGQKLCALGDHEKKKQTQAKEEAQSARLSYVAVTRAEKKLYLICPRSKTSEALKTKSSSPEETPKSDEKIIQTDRDVLQRLEELSPHLFKKVKLHELTQKSVQDGSKLKPESLQNL